MLKPPSEKISAETREKLLALAEFIENDRQHGFHMGVWWCKVTGGFDRYLLETDPEHAHCGTAGCLAGFTLVQHGVPEPRDFSGYPNSAARVLGLNGDQRGELFCQIEHRGDPITRAHAVRVLRNFAYTGEVDWSV